MKISYFIFNIILFILFVLGIAAIDTIIYNVLYISYSLLNISSDFFLEITGEISFFMLSVFLISTLVYIFIVCVLIVLSLLMILFNFTVYKFYLKLLDTKCLRSYFNYLSVRSLFMFNKVLLLYLGHRVFPEYCYIIWRVDFHYFLLLSVLISPIVMYALYSIKDDKDFGLNKKKFIISIITSLLIIFIIKFTLYLLLVNYPILSEILLYCSILCIDLHEVNTECSYVDRAPILTKSEMICESEKRVPIRPPRIEPFFDYKGDKIVNFDAYKANRLDPQSVAYVQSNETSPRLTLTRAVEGYLINLNPPIGPGVVPGSDVEDRAIMFNGFIRQSYEALKDSKEVNIALDRASLEFSAAQEEYKRANVEAMVYKTPYAYNERNQRFFDLQRKETMYANLYNYINFCRNDLGPLLTLISNESKLLDLDSSKYKLTERSQSLLFFEKETFLQITERGRIISRHRQPGYNRSQESYLGFRKHFGNDHNIARFFSQEKSIILSELKKKHNQIYWN